MLAKLNNAHVKNFYQEDELIWVFNQTGENYKARLGYTNLLHPIAEESMEG